MQHYSEYYCGRTILITGGAGAIGSNLAASMADIKDSQIIIVDDLSSAARWNIPQKKNVRFIYGSVTDDSLLKHVYSFKPTLVYHLAALFANQNSIDHPENDLMVNGMGTLKVLQYSNLTGVEKVIYASSGCSVYGKSPLPLIENFTSLDLDTPYQITKMLGETYCNYFKNYYGLKTVRCRFFNSFGPGEIPGAYRNVIPNFVYWSLKGQPLPIMGTGEETRDWTYVGDIVDGLLRAGALDSAVGEAMNLASGTEHKVIDVANWINELTGNRSGIVYTPRRKWDTKSRLLASIDKAKQIIGYEPKTDFRQGLKNTVQWFRENWNRIEASASF
ncbi:MAG: NAD-dependent epimerase/dehydratase family protein [Acidobacteriota bacterium]